MKELEDLGMSSGDDVLVLRRIVNQAGKNRIYINGSLSTLNVLERIAQGLVEITGQHEHHSLRQPAAQLAILDRFAGLEDKCQEFGVLYREHSALVARLEALQTSARGREQTHDFLRFQLQEIESFNPQVGEDQDLQTRVQRSRFSKKLSEFAQNGEAILYSQEQSVSTQLAELARVGESFVDLDPKLKAPVAGIRDALALVDEAAFALRDYARGDGPDAEELDQLESRMSDLKKLQRKYGATVEEILEFKAKIQSEMNQLENNDSAVNQLTEQIAGVEHRMGIAAAELHRSRAVAAEKLSKKINQELLELNMKGSNIKVQVKETPQLLVTGQTEVLFTMKSSPQDEPKPLSRIASGGELSRVMLAIKQVNFSTQAEGCHFKTHTSSSARLKKQQSDNFII
jgi:DNA repair protein RecN (Recombination protein N)